MTPEQKRLALDVAGMVRGAAWRPGETEMEQDGTHGFTMERETFACGSPACLAGWTVARAHALGLGGPYADIHYNLQWQARQLLGLSALQGRALFMPMGQAESTGPGWSGYHYRAEPGEEGFISPEHAAACIEHLTETGGVDWVGTAPHTQETHT